jgi:hypothetical protein
MKKASRGVRELRNLTFTVNFDNWQGNLLKATSRFCGGSVMQS